MTREVNRSSLRRLTCPAQDHFICITLPIISRHVVLSLTQMLVCLSLYVILSILVSMLVCAAASLFCACLVSVRISAPYAIADITLELYIRMFRQTTWLFFKITRCVAYVAQPATILRCISLSWFFSLRFLCCPKYVAFDIFNQHIVHVDCGHHTCLCDSLCIIYYVLFNELSVYMPFRIYMYTFSIPCFAIMLILLGFVLSQMPSRYLRTQRRMVCSMHVLLISGNC